MKVNNLSFRPSVRVRHILSRCLLRLHKRRCLAVFIFALSCVLGTNAYGQGKGYGVQVRLMSPPLVQVKPGEIVSATFVVENMTGREETFEESLVLPEGWHAITPSDVFTLQTGQEAVRMLAFQVPNTAEAKDYEIIYSVRSKRDYAIRDEVALGVSVLSVGEMKLFLESAPDTVTAGQTYEIRIRITNSGNSSLDVLISARSSSDYPLTLSAKEMTLKPGKSAPISLSVHTPSKIPKSLNHIVTLEASSKKDPSVATSLSVRTEVLSQMAKVDLYQRVPATLTLRSLGQKDEDKSEGFDVELEGKGYLKEGSSQVEFLFRGPDTQDKSLYGERDEYYLNYSDPKFDFRVGDQSYGLSYLTSYSRYGRGIEAKYHPEDKNFNLGSYSLKSRFGAPEWDEQGIYVESRPSSNAALKINYLKRKQDSYYVTPSLKDDIYSVEGSFKPARDMDLEVEYAEGKRRGRTKDLKGSAYDVNMSGNLKKFRYSFSKTHAEPDFYGYYNDSDYTSSSLSFLLSKRLNGFVSYSSYETNLDMDPDRGDTSTEETLFQAGVNYSLASDWYIQFAYDEFSRKDKLQPSNYDISEKAYRFSIGRSAEKFNYRLEARYADQHDRIKGVSASPWNYSFYASYMPSAELFLTLYGGFGDNSAIEGSRLLSDQDNLGLSFRWQATERLTLSGWYTKYNFNSKRPESDQYNFELKYLMPDESYWSFKIRRYDWEYGEYVETNYVLSYSIPIGIPVGKKKSLGVISGKVWELQDDAKEPLSRAVATLNGSKTATDAGGRFTFSAPPGTYLLNMDLSSMGFGKTTEEKLPMKVTVEAGKTVNVELTIVKAATLSGQVVLGKSELARAPETTKPVILGEPGSAETPQVFKGVLVELSRDDETIRTLTDDEGKFSFMNIRPGTWKFKAYDYNLPAYHYIQNPEMEIMILPGEKKDITLKVVPKKRQIEILEEGVISNKKIN